MPQAKLPVIRISRFCLQRFSALQIRRNLFYGGLASVATDVLDEVKAMPELGLRPKAINDFNGNRHTQQLFQVYWEML